MHQYIEQLRKKSYHHKRRVALGASGAITALIFMAWLSVILPSNTAQIVARSGNAEQSSVDEQGNTPIEALKNSTAQAYSAVRDMFVKSASSINLQEDYTKMRSQVETGQIKIVPVDSRNTQ